MLRALDEYEIGGVATLLGFHRALLSHPCFVDGGTCHGIVESEALAEQAAELERQTARPPRPAGRLADRRLAVEVDGRRFDVRLHVPEPPFAALARRRRERGADPGAGSAGHDAVVSPMQGTVLDVLVVEGERVRAGQVLCIVEAMKMENEIAAHRDGVVTGLSVQADDPVTSGQVICVVVADAAEPG